MHNNAVCVCDCICVRIRVCVRVCVPVCVLCLCVVKEVDIVRRRGDELLQEQMLTTFIQLLRGVAIASSTPSSAARMLAAPQQVRPCFNRLHRLADCKTTCLTV